MIDPDNIRKLDCTQHELEERILFWVAAAGKSAHPTAKALEAFLRKPEWSLRHAGISVDSPPFELIRSFGNRVAYLARALRYHGFGCFRQRARSFMALARSELDLAACGPDELMAIPGIGAKTARGFILYTRPDVRYAVLDRHVLRFMREQGLDAPKDSPQSASGYARWESQALALADRLGQSPLEFDRMIWLRYRIPPKNPDDPKRQNRKAAGDRELSAAQRRRRAAAQDPILAGRDLGR
jgi:hypothetical protein